MKPVLPVSALLSVALLAGCGTDGGTAPGKTARELNVTMSSVNGLYFSPHLLIERGSIGDILAAVDTAELLGQASRLHPSAAIQAKLRSEALAAYGVNAYGHLASLYRAGATRVLLPEDVATLAKLRQPDGSYTADLDAPLPPLQGQVQATGSALFALKTLHRLPVAQEKTAIRWLTRVAATATDSATVRLALRAARDVDPATNGVYHGPVPDLAAARTAAPAQRTAMVEDTVSYVDAVGVVAARAHLDRAAVTGLYEQNVATADFPTLRSLVTLMLATGASVDDLAAARRRLAAARLPSGLYRDSAEDLGSAIATVYALRLLRMRGEPTKSHRLADALMKYAQLDEVRNRPAERLIAVGASVAAGREQSTAETKRLCNNPSVVPTVVTQANVVGWAEMTRICSEAGTKSPAPQLAPWPAKTTEQVVAQAMMVNALQLTGRHDAIPSWVDRSAMWRLLQQPASRVSLLQSATVGSAYLALTGGDGRERLDGVTMRAQKARGCSHLPDLYTTGGTDVSCDLRTTIAVDQFLSS